MNIFNKIAGFIKLLFGAPRYKIVYQKIQSVDKKKPVYIIPVPIKKKVRFWPSASYFLER